MAAPVGVLGASGQVGSRVVEWLRQEQVGPLRLGGRRSGRLRASPGVRAEDQVWAFDLDDDRGLADFCRGCRVLVNCAGPSYRVLDRVARFAAEHGCDYVDVSGDGPAHGLLSARMPDASPTRMVLSAGMLPGLANLMPAWLDGRQGGALTVYSGGVEALGGAAAADLVLSLQPPDATAAEHLDYGEAGASWELGARRSRGLAAQDDVRLDFFPGKVSLLPFLSPDAERLALRHRLTRLHWFNVFSGTHLRETLTGLRGRVDDLNAAVGAVERAGQLDLLGLRPYYTMVFVHQRPLEPVRRAVVTTDSSLALTAAVAVSATLAVLRGSIPVGLHFADDVLPPERTVEDVLRLHAGTRVVRHALNDAALCEGAL